jgi:hypothetical protein
VTAPLRRPAAWLHATARRHGADRSSAMAILGRLWASSEEDLPRHSPSPSIMTYAQPPIPAQ